MSLAKHEFTDSGRSMLGRAQAAETLNITKIVLGSGVASQPSDLFPLTSLKQWVMDVNITTKNDYGNGTMLVEGSFLSNAAPSAFQLREVGVMAHIGTEADRLYSVANVFADPPDTIDPASPSVQGFKIKLIIDRIPTDQLIVQIGPTEAVTGENIGADTVGKGWFKEAIANLMRFKRAVEGTGISIVEDASGDFITIGVKELLVDLDVYVPPSHPNCPNPDVGFPTVQAAHDYLTQWRIPSSRLARINVWKGTYVSPPITFFHPDAKQIQLLGWPRETYQVSAIAYISPTSKRVTLSAAPGTALQVGMLVYLADASGHSGGCRITAISSNVITCSTIYRGAHALSNPFTTAVGAGPRLCRYPTVLECDTQTSLQNLLGYPNGLGLCDSITFHKGAYGIGGGDAALKNIMVIGMAGGTNRRGVTAGGALAQIGGESIITDWDFGFTSRSGGALWVREQTYINACNSGFNPGGGGGAMAALNSADTGNILYINHCGMGIQCWGGANCSGGCILIGVCDQGIDCNTNSVVTVGVGNDLYVLYYGNALDIRANAMSFVQNNKYNGAGPDPLKCSPTPEQLGNLNSLIHLV
jgi:hypothetical protein